MIRSRQDLSASRRVVVKVGSALLTDEQHGVRVAIVEQLAQQIAALHQQGVEVCLVSSGAVSLGRVQLGWLGRRLTVHEKQAAAAVGQPLLMNAYKACFARHDIQVAQMLLTKDDLRHRRRYLNAKNTSQTLFDAGVLPVVNENDTVMVEEIKFGDNDNLAALVSLVIGADLMVLMTDVNGLYSKHPCLYADAERIALVDDVTSDIMELASDSKSGFGTGGMRSKLQAATIARRGGVATAIVHGDSAHVLQHVLQGLDVGTLVLCGHDRQSSRSHWIADVLHVEGVLHVDAGAARAIAQHGASLLSVGMRQVDGHFDKGACLEVHGPDGVVAKGLCNYTADEMRKLCGIASENIETVLGYVDFDSMIHRDNLVLQSES